MVALIDNQMAVIADTVIDDALADEALTVHGAEVRRALERIGQTIGPHDLQIAAVALQHGLTLVTHDTREFARISALRLEDWEP